MTLDQLIAFVWVHRTGGMRRAAETLNVSQPALSNRISNLERVMGHALFERTPGGMTVTSDGARLLRYAEHMVDLHDHMRTNLARGSGTETVRIGASETIAQAWLPDLLAAIHAAHPRATLDLSIDISVNLRSQLLARQLDLVLVMGPLGDPEVVDRPLPSFPLQWLANPSRLPVDLSVVPIITYARQTKPYREMRDLALAHNGPTVRLFPSASLSAAIALIARGVGVGAYPVSLALDEIAAGIIVPFEHPWQPEALTFTASTWAQSANPMAHIAAELAVETAKSWHAAGPKR
ncbi:MAG: LysR family transcriptional regulator [Pseudomonadota bacterium]